LYTSSPDTLYFAETKNEWRRTSTRHDVDRDSLTCLFVLCRIVTAWALFCSHGTWSIKFFLVFFVRFAFGRTLPRVTYPRCVAVGSRQEIAAARSIPGTSISDGRMIYTWEQTRPLWRQYRHISWSVVFPKWSLLEFELRVRVISFMELLKFNTEKLCYKIRPNSSENLPYVFRLAEAILSGTDYASLKIHKI